MFKWVVNMRFMTDLITSPVAFIKHKLFSKFEEILDQSPLCPVLEDFRIKLCLDCAYGGSKKQQL